LQAPDSDPITERIFFTATTSESVEENLRFKPDTRAAEREETNSSSESASKSAIVSFTGEEGAEDSVESESEGEGRVMPLST